MTAIRINYHDTQRLPLITGPVETAFRTLRDQAPDSPIFFRSGWLHGPHIDLCILGTGIAEDAVTDQMSKIQEWIDAHPSQAGLSEKDYLATARKLGSLEGIPEPYTPLSADNSVEQVAYRPPRLVDGHESLQPAYADFLSDTAPTLFRLARLKQSNNGVATLILIAMLAKAADQFEPEGIERGYISLRAHADFFFANFDRQGAFRARFDALAEQWREAVAEAIGPAQDIGRDEGVADEVADMLRDWSAILAQTKKAVRQIAKIDNSWFSYTPDSFPDQQDPDLVESFDRAGLRREIAKGETLDTVINAIGDGLDPSFFSSEGFQVFRIILNMFYSMLPTLGVSPAERFGMCHIVARTVEDGAVR